MKLVIITAAVIIAATASQAEVIPVMREYCDNVANIAELAPDTPIERKILTDGAADAGRGAPFASETMIAAINMGYAGFDRDTIERFCLAQMEYVMYLATR